MEGLSPGRQPPGSGVYPRFRGYLGLVQTRRQSGTRTVAGAEGNRPNRETSLTGTYVHGPETVEGYVIDVGCVRKNARENLHEKARAHSRDCALMGHYVESGYGIVTDDDRLTVLDAEATPAVLDVVADSDTEEGIRLRVQRERQDGEMTTTGVEEVD